ncbi:hypothetical protein KAU88_07315 [Candidatus Bathyarchaeota archaeon]|nr:hypothetical protein [Candidatus Bathyarchaeota archaeon]
MKERVGFLELLFLEGIAMNIRIPSKKVCENFHLIYELKGAQKGVNVLTEYYGIQKMKIILNGRRVMRACECDYFEGIACFTKKGLNKRNVLHELYHHIVENKGLEMSDRKEEKEASSFSRKFTKML